MSFDVVGFVGSQAGLFSQALSDQSINWQKEQQFAIQAFQKNDYLAKVAMGNPNSAQNAIINVAAIGITLNPAAKLAYLVPRDGGVHLDISYMGLLHLAQVSGAIQWGQCKLVYANDTYENKGLDVAPVHSYSAFGDRGEIVGAYSTVKTPTGDYLTHEMSVDAINKTRARSTSFKSGRSSPWLTDYEEMAKKTCLKQGSKYWPRCERMDKAIHYLNESGEGIEMEPVMQHKPEVEIAREAADRAGKIESIVSDLIDGMKQADNIDDLKAFFADAYTKSKGTKMQSTVQAEYAKKKKQLEEATI